MMRYEVHRAGVPIPVDGDWDKPAWRGVPALELTHFMGERPAHRPRTQARLAWDDEAVYVIFRVQDRYVRAVTPAHQGRVCADSCVEFFFAPADDTAGGYFNLEMNCGGTMLLHFQKIPRKDMKPLEPADVDSIRVAHTMPRIVDPEITEPTTWTVEYRLPTAMLRKYRPDAVMPAPGVVWRANFFKCADATSHPHWLTWALVDRPRPDFHVPECFGRIVFR